MKRMNRSTQILAKVLEEADPRVLISGWKYFIRQRIKSYDEQPQEISGRVQGKRNSYIYNTNIIQLDDDKLSYECDCPSIVSPCKHSVALALKYYARENRRGIWRVLPISFLLKMWRMVKNGIRKRKGLIV
jgi:uncharacterized Zn finger protein